MLIRLLLTLMLALVAIPASAAMACHEDMPAMTAMVMPGRHHAPAAPTKDDATPAHFCIGCVPPSALLGARLPAPLPLPVAPPLARIASFDPGASDPPTLPPPRQA